MSVRTVCFFALSVSILAQTAFPSNNSTTPQIRNHSFYLKGTGTRGPFQLPHAFVIPESLRVVDASGAILSQERYQYDSPSGILYLELPLQLGDSLLITYTYLVTDLKKRYYHKEIAPLSVQPSPEKTIYISQSKVKTTQPNNVQDGSSFELKGTKTFSVEAGNSRDFQFKQGLDLTLKGKITEEVQVSAFLSDRGDFNSPQGSTQKWEELDKLKLEVTSPNFAGSLGDQQIDHTETRLTGFSKKFKGVQSRANFSNLSLETAIANSKGTFHSNQIYGQDGRQGPYFLSSRQGRTRIAILSGTEKVWLDGELLQRGSDLDYTIDYLNGSLQFTPRRLITSQSVIRVDFEYSQEDFPRKFVASRAQLSLKDGTVKLGGSFVSEGDLRENPLGFSLSPVQKQTLISAGDLSSRAQESGAIWVGANLGDYLLVTDSTGPNFYKYAGEKNGDYQVKFSYTGERQGDYIYQGAGVFTYVGQNIGNYSPLQNLPVPKNHNLLGLDLALQPNQNWDIQLELAQSNLDKNTFSSLDDRDNQGWGFDSKVDFNRSELNWWGQHIKQIRTSAGLFLQDDNFLPLTRLDETQADRIWNLNPQIQTKRELKWHFSPEVILARNFSLSSNIARLRRGNEFTSSRQSWEVNLPSIGSGSFNFSLDQTKSRFDPPGDSLAAYRLWRSSQNLSWNQPVKLWLLRSGLNREERKQPATGERWKKLELGLASNSSSSLAYQTDWSRTSTDHYNTGWMSYSVSRTWRVRGSLREWRNTLSSSWEYTRNKITSLQPLLENRVQNLARWRLDFTPPGNYLNLELSYLLNQGGVALKSYNYVRVPDGQGDYRLENGEYVPDPSGNYELLIENSGDFRQTLSAEKSFHITLEPARFWSKKGTLDRFEKLFTWLHSDTYLRLENQVADKSGLGADFFLPWRSLESDSAYLKNYNWQQELKITPSFCRHYFVLRWHKESLKSGKYLSGVQESESYQRDLTAYLKLGPGNLLELRQLRSVKEQQFSGYPSHRILGQEFILVFTKRLSNFSQYSLTGKYLSEEDSYQSVSSALYSVAPSFTYSPNSNLRWRGKLGWSRVKSNTDYLSWLLAEGKKNGDNFDWDLGFDLKLRQNFHYSAFYRGNLLAHRRALHFFKLDLIATF